MEWPEAEPEPVHYWLCSLPARTALRTLVNTAMMRWRIERDYQGVEDRSLASLIMKGEVGVAFITT